MGKFLWPFKGNFPILKKAHKTLGLVLWTETVNKIISIYQKKKKVYRSTVVNSLLKGSIFYILIVFVFLKY